MKPIYQWSLGACVTLLAGIAACSSGDSGSNAGAGGAAGAAGFGGAAPQQMGNGFGMGGQGNAGATTTAGGAVGAGGVSAGGIMGMMLGTGGGPAPGGATGSSGGVFGSGGTSGMVGMGGTLGTGGAQGGTAGAQGGMSTGMGGTTMTGMDPESGRLVGITAAHNAVRAAVMTMPALPPLMWSDALATYAQQWADSLAMTSCSSPHHRTEQELQAKGYGENLAAFSSTFGSSTAQQAVDGWANEKMCWTFGTFYGTEKCDMTCYAQMNSDGCGHYTQIVWRKSTMLGCGVASCMNGQFKTDIWICNYAPPGNYVGQNPY